MFALHVYRSPLAVDNKSAQVVSTSETANHIAYESARLAICVRGWPDLQDKSVYEILSKR
jgi:hypothetical protein